MATPKTNAQTKEWEINGKMYTLPVHGPFGDKMLHGSVLQYTLRSSDSTKRSEDEPEYVGVLRVGVVDYWLASYWAAANIGDVKRFGDSKPDTLVKLVNDKLATDAGQLSWREVRGNGALNVWCSFNGAPPSWMPKTAVDALLAAGHTVKVLDSPRKGKGK